MKKKIMIIAGARPNFMKIAPLMKEFRNHPSFEAVLVHTGQHYDFQMSETFFQDLDIPKPDVYLNVGSGSHAVQKAKIMMAFEEVLLQKQPDLLIVVGDVNSTVACSLVAAKLSTPVAHVEAGLRSFDRGMPEEINRLVTDALSDYLFVSEASGMHNLKKEGLPKQKVHFVGNVMIDTLLGHRAKIAKSDIMKKLALKPKTYCVVTLHRPSNVDSKEALEKILDILEAISRRVKIVYPIHPRSRKMIQEHGIHERVQKIQNLSLLDPQGYVDFIQLVKNASFVLTDSGGIQEETTVLRVPCLTMRDNTERPVTIKLGTNRLVRRNKEEILRHIDAILRGRTKQGQIPPYWDGRAAKRIVKVLQKAMK